MLPVRNCNTAKFNWNLVATSSQFVATSWSRLIGRRVPCFSRINCRRRIVQSRHARRILLLWTLSECSQSNALARFAGGALPPLAISCPSVFLLHGASRRSFLLSHYLILCVCVSLQGRVSSSCRFAPLKRWRNILSVLAHTEQRVVLKEAGKEREGELLKNRRTQNSVCSSGLKWGSIFGSVCASDFSPFLLSFIEKLAVLRKCVG